MRPWLQGFCKVRCIAPTERVQRTFAALDDFLAKDADVRRRAAKGRETDLEEYGQHLPGGLRINSTASTSSMRRFAGVIKQRAEREQPDGYHPG